MAQMQQPVGQVRLTNVAVVRYKRAGKRFEIACYKNKVMNWRNKIEKDIDEVLQSHRVFYNVSKGVIAKKADFMEAFGTEDEEEVVRMILDKGDLQVSEKEREAEFESKEKDIVSIVVQKCINKETKRPFPPQMIESAMKEVGFVLRPNKSAKQQALHLIQELQKVLPIERAQMRLRLVIPRKQGKDLKAALEPLVLQWEEENWDGDFEALVLIDPGSFRAIDEKLREQTKGKATMEILDLQVFNEGDETL